MTRIEIENLTVEELKELIAEVFAKELKNHHAEFLKQEEFLGRRDVANIFKVSLVTIDAWRRKGILKPYKIGKRILFKRSELDRSLRIMD